RLRHVVPQQRVRARVRDRSRDGRDHDGRHRRLHPPDGEDRGGAMSAVTPIAPTPVAPAVRSTVDRRRLRRGKLVRRVGLNIVALAVFALMVFPVYWMVATAFKPG